MNEQVIKNLISEMSATGNISDEGLYALLTENFRKDISAAKDMSDVSLITALLAEAADKKRKEIYGKDVFIRGLIEFTNYCKNNCYYCGIRCGNQNAIRYRLSSDEILECCEKGYEQGFRTFVLQGGEDLYFTDDMLCDIISSIKIKFSDCAITLSVGEKERAAYEAYFKAGATRYLLRHETADNEHYKKLHPDNMSLDNRMRCLYDLREIGYQLGAGFMVGSPFQNVRCIVKDIRFLQKLNPHMIGVGPYINHRDTPFASYENGSAELTLRVISILRLLFPYANIPSTTAMGTIIPGGRELGIKAGGNVIMPNITPLSVRENYRLYENKRCRDDEAIEGLDALKEKIKKAGYEVVVAVGDSQLQTG